MHMETQSKTKKPSSFIKTLSVLAVVISLNACSFVELHRGAENIIFAQQGDGCEQVKEYSAEVKTTTLFIDRKPKAIAEELQILAQNEAYAIYANAIWPTSEIKDGIQTFDLLKCESR